MKLVYFAWVRERVGHAEEVVDLPAEVGTAGDLVAWLRTRGENYADAFRDGPIVRIAVDRRHARADMPIAGASEIAFFPPMTGG